MVPFRSESAIRIKSDDIIVLSKSPRRRIVYGVAAMLLIITTVISLDPTVDFQGGRLFGTIFMFFLIIASALAAGMSRSFIFDRSKNHLLKRHMFLGISLGEPAELLSLDTITAIHLVDLQLLRSRKQEMRDPADRAQKAVKSGLFESRAHLHQLSVESAEKKILIQESSYADELEVTAEVLTAFLGVPVTRTVSH